MKVKVTNIRQIGLEIYACVRLYFKGKMVFENLDYPLIELIDKDGNNILDFKRA
jgi:hypothetical protein